MSTQKPRTRRQAESLQELGERIEALYEAYPPAQDAVEASVMRKLATITWEDALDIQRRCVKRGGGC